MLSSLSNGAYRTTVDQTDGTSETTEVVGLYVVHDEQNTQQIFNVTSTRNFNSKKTKDSQFIVFKVKIEGQPTIHKILKVNKKTEKVYLEIKLLDPPLTT